MAQVNMLTDAISTEDTNLDQPIKKHRKLLPKPFEPVVINPIHSMPPLLLPKGLISEEHFLFDPLPSPSAESEFDAAAFASQNNRLLLPKPIENAIFNTGFDDIPGETIAEKFASICEIALNPLAIEEHKINCEILTREIPPLPQELLDFVPPQGWDKKSAEKTVSFTKNQNGCTAVEVSFDSNLLLSVSILGFPAPQHILQQLPKVQQICDIDFFLKFMGARRICTGNYEENMSSFFNTTSKRGRYCAKSNSLYAITCKLWSTRKRCSECSFFRGYIRKWRSKQNAKEKC